MIAAIYAPSPPTAAFRHRPRSTGRCALLFCVVSLLVGCATAAAAPLPALVPAADGQYEAHTMWESVAADNVAVGTTMGLEFCRSVRETYRQQYGGLYVMATRLGPCRPATLEVGAPSPNVYVRVGAPASAPTRVLFHSWPTLALCEASRAEIVPPRQTSFATSRAVPRGSRSVIPRRSEWLVSRDGGSAMGNSLAGH